MARHPDTDLVPYLRGELPPAERERVARHLEECPDCKQDTELLRDLLGNLAHAIGEPPEISWPRYRAELRAKLEARRALVPWWRRPMPLALSASLAGALLFVAVWGGRELTKSPDAIGPEEVAIGSELVFTSTRARSRASPKSSSFTRPVCDTKMFAGLRSR